MTRLRLLPLDSFEYTRMIIIKTANGRILGKLYYFSYFNADEDIGKFDYFDSMLLQSIKTIYPQSIINVKKEYFEEITSQIKDSLYKDTKEIIVVLNPKFDKFQDIVPNTIYPQIEFRIKINVNPGITDEILESIYFANYDHAKLGEIQNNSGFFQQ